jgi:hypothetical protein
VGASALEDYSFSYLKIVFFCHRVEEGQKEKLRESEGKRCKYIKDWFKNQSSRSIYLVCLAKFSTPMDGFAPGYDFGYRPP